jgi:hypothetical protein
LPTPTINLDELLVGSRNPALDVGIREGSRIALMPRAPAVSPYSPENLPEFMAGFEQVTPTTFAPVIGGTTTAGMTPEELALYQQREQAFRESFAIDPTMFGGGYRPSQFTVLPPPAAPVEEEPFDVAGAIAAVNVLSDVDLPDIDLPDVSGFVGQASDFVQDTIIDPIDSAIDTAGEFVEDSILDPVGDAISDASDFVKEKIIEPTGQVLDSAITYVDDVIVDPIAGGIETAAKVVDEAVVEPLSNALNTAGSFVDETIIEPTISAADAAIDFIDDKIVEPTGEALANVGEFIEETITDPVTDFVENLIPDFEQAKKIDIDLGGAETFVKNAVNVVGSAQNLEENPTVQEATNLVDSIDSLILDTGFNRNDVIAKGGGAVIDAAAVASIVNAFEDPTAENLTNAYAGADHLAMNYTEAGGVPLGSEIGAVGTILSGIKAAEGGIENVGEAVQVGAAASAAASLIPVASQGAISGGLTAAGSFLGPAAALITLGGLLDRKGTKMGHGFIQRDDAGNYSVKSHDTKEGGYQVIIPEIHVAGTVMRDLEEAYGYEFDEAAWDSLDKKIDFDAKNPKNFRGAYDIVVEALQTGALKETDATPETIDWESLFVDARENVDSKLPADKKRLQDPYYLDTRNYYLSKKRIDDAAVEAIQNLPQLFATTPFDLYGTGITTPAPPPLSEQELADLGITEDTVFSFDLGNLGSFSLF